jgi:glutamate---cysteine ligase / carboxylate-amine ligase
VACGMVPAWPQSPWRPRRLPAARMKCAPASASARNSLGQMTPRSVGVEEELLLVDPDSGRARALSPAVLRDAPKSGYAALTSELMCQQIEINTRPCHSLEQLADEVRRLRRAANDAAERLGGRIVALATSPLPVEPSVVSSPRYQRVVDEFGLTAKEQLTCGCHVHVQIESE